MNLCLKLFKSKCIADSDSNCCVKGGFQLFQELGLSKKKYLGDRNERIILKNIFQFITYES